MQPLQILKYMLYAIILHLLDYLLFHLYIK